MCTFFPFFPGFFRTRKKALFPGGRKRVFLQKKIGDSYCPLGTSVWREAARGQFHFFVKFRVFENSQKSKNELKKVQIPVGKMAFSLPRRPALTKKNTEKIGFFGQLPPEFPGKSKNVPNRPQKKVFTTRKFFEIQKKRRSGGLQQMSPQTCPSQNTVTAL
jgi:hypothetical protein